MKNKKHNTRPDWDGIKKYVDGEMARQRKWTRRLLKANTEEERERQVTPIQKLYKLIEEMALDVYGSKK